MQGQQPRELGPDRHLAPLAALAVLDGDHALGEADVLDPQGHELGDPGAGLEQGLHHQPDLAALGVGLVDEAQLLLQAQPGRGAAPLFGRGLSPALLAGGFEHRLGLEIVEPLAGEEGGDRVGDAVDVAGHEFALKHLENKPACSIGRRGATLKPPAGVPAVSVFLSELSGKPSP